MSTTRISDVIVPAIFNAYVINRTVQQSALFRSGIISTDAEMQALAKGANTLYSMPYWSDLSSSGRSNLGSDDPATKSSPAKIGSGKDQARKHFRNKSWSTMDLTGLLAGSDPAAAIGNQLGDYWAADMQTTAILQLNGVIAANIAANSGDMVLDVTIATGTPGVPGASNKIGSDVVLGAKQTMGDAAAKLTAICMHSVLHTNLQKQNLISFQPTNAQDIGWGTYLGYTVIVDDGCPVVLDGQSRPVYTSYLFGAGALGYGEGNPKVPTAVTRDESSGNGEGEEVLYNRKHFILHPRGVKWTETTVTGVTPSDAEMIRADNWSRVYDRKNVRFVAIKSHG
jgi:hypothetical protein